MAKVRGKWELGGIKSFSGSFSLDVTDISFICNGAQFTRFKAYTNASKNGSIRGYFGDAVTDFASISNGSVKWNSGYTIIDFGTEWQTVTEEFYTWLTSKAIELTPSTIFDLTTLHLTGSHLITVKARGAGYIASPASNAVRYGNPVVSGTWVFNDVLTNYNFGDVSVSFNSDATSSNYHTIRYNTTDSGGKYGIIKYVYWNEEAASNYSLSAYTFNNNTWNNQNAKTIKFGEAEQEVPIDFYDWLTANATKQ